MPQGREWTEAEDARILEAARLSQRFGRMPHGPVEVRRFVQDDPSRYGRLRLPAQDLGRSCTAVRKCAERLGAESQRQTSPA